MKKTYLSLCFIFTCIQAVVAQFQCLHSTASFEYVGTTMLLRDSAHHRYISGFSQYDSLTRGWKYDTAYHYSNSGALHVKAYKTFDAAGRVTTFTEMLNANGNWKPERFTRYEYTAAGKMQSEVTHYEGGKYDSTRIYYNYYGNGMLKEVLSQDWDNMWVHRDRVSYAYDGSNREILRQKTTWNLFNAQWENNDRRTTTYAANTTEAITETYKNGNWENGNKVVTTYNANGKIISSEASKWNGTAWQKNWMTGYLYNANNYMEEELQQVWNGTNYTNISKWAYEYDIVKEIVTGRFLFWNAVDNKFEYTFGSYETRDYYQWASSVDNSVVNDERSFYIYPVPAKNILHVRAGIQGNTATSLSINDMNGRLMKTQHLPAFNKGDEAIDIRALPAGIYTLNLYAAGSVMSRKFVVE